MAFPIILFVLFTVTAVARCAPLPLEIIDMTYVFDNSTLHWPTQPAFKLDVKQNGTQKEGYWLQIEEYFSGIHVGTHMDAPCHFAEGRWCTDAIPVARFVAPAAVVDITNRAQENPDALVQIRDLEEWERLSGQSLNGTIVMIRSGWGRRWPDKESYTGTESNDPTKHHYPGMSKEAAQWLVDKRNIYGLGTEALSLDNGQTRDLMAHRILLGKNIYGLENVANMEDIPIFGATLYVLPMKIGNSSGAPVRIIATFPKVNYRIFYQPFVHFWS